MSVEPLRTRKMPTSASGLSGSGVSNSACQVSLDWVMGSTGMSRM